MPGETEFLRVSIRQIIELVFFPLLAIGIGCWASGTQAAPGCTSEVQLRQASADLLAADKEIARGRFPKASSLLLAGIQVLGPFYMDYHRVLRDYPRVLVVDDSGFDLQIARAFEMKGDMKGAADERRASLVDRLDLAKNYNLCARVR